MLEHAARAAVYGGMSKKDDDIRQRINALLSSAAPKDAFKVARALDRKAVTEAIAEIGRRRREGARLEATMNDEIAAARMRYETAAAEHRAAIVQLEKGVRLWCEANRAVLTEGGKAKTVRLASGEVCWRLLPARVIIEDVEGLLKMLKERALSRFIRVKEEVDRRAILAEPEAAADFPGVAIDRSEEFYINPFGAPAGKARAIVEHPAEETVEERGG